MEERPEGGRDGEASSGEVVELCGGQMPMWGHILLVLVLVLVLVRLRRIGLEGDHEGRHLGSLEFRDER